MLESMGVSLTGLRRKKGQGMTEYIIIVGLIALSAIVIVAIFGKQIKAQFSGMTTAMSGNTAAVNSLQTEAETESAEDGQLSQYDSQ
jgi:Flp pilus assembly pilin Flp